MTELEIMVFMYHGSKNLTQISDFICVSRKSTPVYLHRLRKRGIVAGKKRWRENPSYRLTDKGRRMINGLRKRLG